MDDNRKTLDALIGLATVGSGITGIASFVAAFFPFFSGEFTAAGVLLIAAAVSFGLLANAVLRE
jgi:hypothetical protein